jgi:hypothetical protein
VLALPVLLAGPAHAGEVPTVVLGGPSGDALVPVEVQGLYPGGPVATARYVLRREAGFSGGSFSVAARDLEDLERGCNRPETTSGDTTCGDGADQGELTQQLLLGHAWSADVGGCAAASAPTSGQGLAGLEDLVLRAPSALSERDTVCLVVSLALPLSADNRVQSDVTRFDLRLGLVDAQPVDVLAGSVDRPVDLPSTRTDGRTGTRFGAPPSTLPFTGTAVAAFLLWGVVSMLLGWILLKVSRQLTTTAAGRAGRARQGPAT